MAASANRTPKTVKKVLRKRSFLREMLEEIFFPLWQAGFDQRARKVKFLYSFFCLDAKEAKSKGQHKCLRLFVQPAPLQHSDVLYQILGENILYYCWLSLSYSQKLNSLAA